METLRHEEEQEEKQDARIELDVSDMYAIGNCRENPTRYAEFFWRPS